MYIIYINNTLPLATDLYMKLYTELGRYGGTRGGIVIFLIENKRERIFWGANSSPECRARRLLAELMLP